MSVSRLWALALDRGRHRGRKALVRALRLTGAAIAAYVVAQLLLPEEKPLLAPLTALLVVQVTLFSTLTAGVQRVISVLAGVIVAVLFSSVVGFTWWSLGALIAASIIIGQLLRLREQLMEVPISAMLVLAVGGREGPAAGRITETLVGAAVGVLYNVALPGPVQSRTAGEAVEGFAAEVAAVLTGIGDDLVGADSSNAAGRWLEQTRDLARRVDRVDRALIEADESRRLNVRALGTMDTGPALRSGLDALEHCTVALRSACRVLVDSGWESSREDDYGSDLLEVFAVLMHDLAAAVMAFGQLLRAEADAGPIFQEAMLARALEDAREARVRLSDLLTIDPRDDPDLWALDGTLLASVGRVLREIDVEERSRQRERHQREWQARRPAAQAVDRLGATSREIATRPLRRRRAKPPAGGEG